MSDGQNRPREIPKKTETQNSKSADAARAAKIAARKARAAALFAQANASSPKRISVVYGKVLVKPEQFKACRKDTVIFLDRKRTEPAEILVDGRLFARGALVVAGDRCAVKITEIVDKK